MPRNAVRLTICPHPAKTQRVSLPHASLLRRSLRERKQKAKPRHKDANVIGDAGRLVIAATRAAAIREGLEDVIDDA